MLEEDESFSAIENDRNELNEGSDGSDFDAELYDGQVQSNTPRKAQDKFENFMDGSINIRIKPNDCIPYTRIWNIVDAEWVD